MSLYPKTDFPIATVATLVELLRMRAQFDADRLIYRFIEDDDSTNAGLTCKGLDQRARGIAARLQHLGATGERILLLFPPGLDFIAAFFGCLYAGAVAVPAYPPRMNRSQLRLASIIQDVGSKFVLTLSSLVAKVEAFSTDLPQLKALQWIAIDSIAEAEMSNWTEPGTSGESIAFLQYTSGSTSAPKGVMLSHTNLLRNAGLIHHVVEHSSEDRYISWLPMFHDMGFMAGVLQPLYAGIEAVLMSPAAFLQCPLRWLNSISQYKGTTSGGPNFAFDLCARKIKEEEKAHLDLSSWTVAFNGAEPVRAETINQFAKAFEVCGFKREAFFPCYGLAEATLMVAGGKKTTPPLFRTFSAKAVEKGRIEETAGGTRDEYTLTGCGKTLVGQEIVIVDPESRRACAPGTIGEIWVSGPSVGAGYWGKPAETEATFRATVEDRKGQTFLRTGDLGFLVDDELFVTGRLKDLIIIRGLNYYPQDIESTVEKVCPLLRSGCGAAFSITVAGEERVAVVQEADRNILPEIKSIVAKVRDAVSECHGIALHTIVFVKRGTVPKTSSGKIQRRACREALLKNDLATLELWQESPAAKVVPGALPEATVRPPATAEEVEGWILARVGGMKGIRDSASARNGSLVSLGIDSLQATELVHAVEENFNVSVPITEILEGVSVAQLAAQVLGTTKYLGFKASDPQSPSPGPADNQHIPLSYGQQAIWFQQKLYPGSAIYNVFGSIRIRTKLDKPILEKAFHSLVSRHVSLRTVFVETPAGPAQNVRAELPADFCTVDVSGWQEEEISSFLQQQAHAAFDLEQGPLVRVRVLEGGESGQVMLLVLHHIIADFWSLEILVRELFLTYQTELAQVKSDLAPVLCQYPEVVRWQRQMLHSPQAESDCAYWLDQLRDAPVLDLPVDQGRSTEPGDRAANFHLAIDGKTTERLHQVAQECGVTRFAVLLSAFQLLLHRYTNQDDIVVGTPFSGRVQANFAGTIGYFANPLAIRITDFGFGDFRQFVKGVAQRLIAAFEHANYPFPLIVEKLHPERNLTRPPVFQAMFVSQAGTSFTDGVLAAVVSGQQGLQAELEGIALETLVVDHNATDLDLVLTVSEAQGRLAATIKYRSGMFEPATVERMAGHYAAILKALAKNPDCAICELSLQRHEERRELLDWNLTTKRHRPTKCVHEVFEEVAQRTPNAVAAEFAGKELTYAVLNRRANQLAHLLRDSGVGLEAHVGICLERSPEMLIGLLATLKAGGAYVPLDPAYPQERITFMLADAAAPVVLAQRKLASRVRDSGARVIFVDEIDALLDQQQECDLGTIASPANLAYVIYTSGSTGRPKGVQISHSALTNVIRAFQERLQVGGEDTLLAVTSLSFDIAALELFLPVMSGARVVIAPAEEAMDPKALADLLQRSRANIMQATPVMWRSLVEAGWRGDERLRVLCGGEALPPELAQQLHGRSRSTLNVYGPTETTVWSLMHEIETSEKSVPIGRPLANTRVYVLNTHMQPAPVGVPGELAIGGMGLARGYLNRPELTADKFVADPFSGDGGDRLYKTGDLVRWTVQGTLEFLGRIDHQVKVRGFRIELGEIEAVLEQHDRVRQAVVVARECKGGDKRLAAYVVTDSATVDSSLSSSLRAFVKTKLPGYMVPGDFVMLESLPRTANGKIDRGSFPAPEAEAVQTDAPSGTPRTGLEEMLVQIWQGMLGIQSVGIHHNFFELGGHSILAAQVMSRIRSAWGVDLPLKTIFTHPTVAGLAREIELHEREQRGASLPALSVVSRKTDLPLSYGQQRLWFLDQLENGSSAYHLTAAVSLKGQLNEEALASSFSELIRRHEVLRTSFPSIQGRAVQHIHGSSPFRLRRIDLQNAPECEAHGRMIQVLREDEVADFDLANGPLLRGVLVRKAADDYVLQITMHHIISDGWSMGVLVGEVAALYRIFAEGHLPALPELQFQFADYAVWQREWVESGAMDQQRAYWRRQLAGLEALQLPTDHVRGRVAAHEGRTQTLTIGRETHQQVKSLSQANNVTLFMTLLSVFNVLLWRYTGQTDISIGSPIAGRNSEDCEKLIGFFVNTLVLRTRLRSREMSFHDLLREVRQTSIEAFGNQDVPFEKLVEELQPERSLSQTPLFQVMFVMQNAPLPEFELGGVHVSRITRQDFAVQFDLVLEATETSEGLQIAAKYRSRLFDAATIQKLLRHYQQLLEAVVADSRQPIGALPLATQHERQQVLYEWNQTEREYHEHRCVHELFERQASLTPDATALEFEGQELSYRQLNAKANQLAHSLREWGVRPEVRVAICMERSLELMIGLLGIMKAGGAYVPLDPSHPAERLSFMLQDAQAAVTLTQERFLQILPAAAHALCLDRDWAAIEQESDSNLNTVIDPLNSIYCIYTSGSTGTPKGAINTHGGVRNRLLWMQEAYGLRPDDRVLQKTTPSFDVSVWEFFWPLIMGSTLVMARPGGHRDSRYLKQVITEAKVTTLHFVPAMLNAFLEDGGLDRCPGLRRVICSGEALSIELQERFFATSGAELHNLYGPTEAAVDVSFWRCEGGSSHTSVPIGRPIANMRLYILDERMEPTPPGLAGELYIAGVGLARGYLNRPELTAERFIANPFEPSQGDRLYKTGDLARWRTDGTIEYLGRTDHQVKIRGQRIELGEVETVLQQHSEVKQAVVRVREDRSGDRRLVAYVVTHSSSDKVGRELRSYLKKKLPEYMVPAAFVQLDSFPLNPNGKIDVKALPVPQARDHAIEKAYVAPQTPAEKLLAEIWADVLRVARVGIHDNFFELGGDSILSIEIVARANALGLSLSPRNMFEHQTVAQLAQVPVEPDSMRAEQGKVTGEVPLTPIQKWFLEHSSGNPSHFNQAVLLEPKKVLDRELLAQALKILLGHHDALRMRFRKQGAEWKQENLVEETADVVQEIDLTDVSPSSESQAIAGEADKYQASLDLEAGPLLRVVLMQLRHGQRLLIIVHHLVVDAVSWQILIQDLETTYLALANGLKPYLRAKTASFQQWAEALRGYAVSNDLLLESERWQEVERSENEAIPVDGNREENVERWAETVTYWLSEEDTRAIHQELPGSHKISPQEALLAAFTQGMSEATGLDSIFVDVEGHGRQRLHTDIEVSRTIGWFTSLYPVRLEAHRDVEWNPVLRGVKAQMRKIPAGGVGYGILHYLTSPRLARAAKPEIIFNYLGQLDHSFLTTELWKGLAAEACGTVRSPQFHRPYLIEVNGGILGGKLYLSWTYGTRVHRRRTIENWAETVRATLCSLIQHCRKAEPGNYTPADFTEVDLSREEVDVILAKVRGASA
jgi:amino acid adenylation domain-containing protein/non-ribosomal peptide synthase protein (TIGR01720 family)